jgi:hypothetical protein
MVLTFFNRAKKRERGRSDDNDARVFLLSNTAEERVELLWILATNQALPSRRVILISLGL